MYALGDDRVLRITHRSTSDHIKELRDFYAQLATPRTAFALPEIIEQGELEGVHFTVERRIPGSSLGDLLATLEGDDRRRALTSYLDVAEQVQTLSVPAEPAYGEVMGADPVRRDRWDQFLRVRVRRAIAQSRRDLAGAGVDVDDALRFLFAEIDRLLDPLPARRLVHGDYFPGNVIVGDDLRVTGVIDFSWITMVGDATMDFCGAVIFIDVVRGYRPDDVRFVEQLASDRRGPEIRDLIRLYRLYYGFFFSPYRKDDERLFQWCVVNIRRALSER